MLNLLRNWVGAPGAQLRNAAGIALLSSSRRPELHEPLRAWLQEWSERGGARYRDSIALAYAWGMGRQLPYEGLTHLRSAAADQLQRRSFLIAWGVTKSYEPGRARAMVTELVDWARHGPERRQLHAARAFLLIARRTTTDPDPFWPELPQRMRTGDLPLHQVSELWALALTYPGTASLAWRVLSFWLDWAEIDRGVSDQVLAVIRSLAVVPEIRDRLRHQLVHVWREQQRLSSPLLSSLATAIEGV
jgi:hypothetical protein